MTFERGDMVYRKKDLLIGQVLCIFMSEKNEEMIFCVTQDGMYFFGTVDGFRAAKVLPPLVSSRY